MIHWSTAVCSAFTLLLATSALRVLRKLRFAESEAETHELMAMLLMATTLTQAMWLAYFIYW